MLRVKYLEHFSFLNDEHSGGRNRGSCSNTNRLTCQTAFTKEITRCQDSHDRLFADFINDGQFHTPALQIDYALGAITLGVDDLCSLKLLNFSRHTGRIEKSLGIESELLLEFYIGFDLLGNRGCQHIDTT